MTTFAVCVQIVEATRVIQDLFVQNVLDAQERGISLDPNLSAEDSTDLADVLKDPAEEDEDEMGSQENLTGKGSDQDPLQRAEGDGKSGEDTAMSSTIASVNQLVSDISGMTYSVAEMMANKICKLMAARDEENSKSAIKDFISLHSKASSFVKVIELYSARTHYTMKTVLLAQTKIFIKLFHEEKGKDLAMKVEQENWVPTQVPKGIQDLVYVITQDSGVPTEVKREYVNVLTASVDLVYDKTTSIEDLDQAGDLNLEAEMKQLDLNDQMKPPNQYLMIQNDKFVAVGISLHFVKTIGLYLHCAKTFTGLTPDIFTKLVEVMKLYNSRVCQMILGAGAMRSAGLKNITAKHIALASQTIGIGLKLIPIIKSSLSDLFSEKQKLLLNDLDRIARDYREHQSELHSKLISIMQERLDVHAEKLMKINWDRPSDKDIPDPASPSTHMITMVKEIATLQKVLNRYLPSDAAKVIITKVYSSFVERLETDWKRLDIFTSNGKNR